MASSPTGICKTHSEAEYTRCGLTTGGLHAPGRGSHTPIHPLHFSQLGLLSCLWWPTFPLQEQKPFLPRTWLFTQQVFNKCCPASYQWWQGSEISFFSFTNISPWKDLTGLPYLSSCLIGWSPLLVFQTGAAKQEAQVVWPRCQSFLGYTYDLVSPDPDWGSLIMGTGRAWSESLLPQTCAWGQTFPL